MCTGVRMHTSKVFGNLVKRGNQEQALLGEFLDSPPQLSINSLADAGTNRVDFPSFPSAKSPRTPPE